MRGQVNIIYNNITPIVCESEVNSGGMIIAENNIKLYLNLHKIIRSYSDYIHKELPRVWMAKGNGTSAKIQDLIDPQHHRFSLSVKSSDEYRQKILRQHFCSKIWYHT